MEILPNHRTGLELSYDSPTSVTMAAGGAVVGNDWVSYPGSTIDCSAAITTLPGGAGVEFGDLSLYFGADGAVSVSSMALPGRRLAIIVVEAGAIAQLHALDVVDEAVLRAAIAAYFAQHPPTTSSTIQVLYRDANWDAANVDGFGGGFWSGKGGNGATGAIEFGWYTVPAGATRIYLPLYGGGYKVGALGLVAFIDPAGALKGSKTADQIIIHPISNAPYDEGNFKYRFSILLSEVGLSDGDVFKIRIEDNQEFDTHMALLGFVPEMVIFGV